MSERKSRVSFGAMLLAPFAASRQLLDKFVESRAGPRSPFPECSDVALETLEPAIVPMVRRTLTELRFFKDTRPGIMDRPVWDIILMVFVDQFDGVRVTTDRLMRASRDDRSQTLRYINSLVADGILERVASNSGESANGIRISRPMRRAIVEYFLQHAEDAATPMAQLSFSKFEGR